MTSLYAIYFPVIKHDLFIPDKLDLLVVSKSFSNFGISAHRESFLALSISTSTPLVSFFAMLKYFTSKQVEF